MSGTVLQKSIKHPTFEDHKHYDHYYFTKSNCAADEIDNGECQLIGSSWSTYPFNFCSGKVCKSDGVNIVEGCMNFSHPRGWIKNIFYTNDQLPRCLWNPVHSLTGHFQPTFILHRQSQPSAVWRFRFLMPRTKPVYERVRTCMCLPNTSERRALTARPSVLLS